MKILILTTNTPHHIYFVREISMRYKLSGIVVEENLLIPPFDIDHPFEKLRDSYEKKALLNDTLESFSDYSETKSFKSINDAECEKYVLVRRYMEDFEKSDRGNFECLFKICDVMCGARMIRRNSDIRGYWSSRNKALKIDNGDSTDEYYFEKFIHNSG